MQTMLDRLKNEKENLLNLYREYETLNNEKRLLERLWDIERKIYPKNNSNSFISYIALSLILINLQLTIPAGSFVKFLILLVIILNVVAHNYRIYMARKRVELSRQKVQDKEDEIIVIYNAMLESRELIYELIDEIEQYQNTPVDIQDILSPMRFLEENKPSNKPRMKLLTSKPIIHE